MTEASMTDSQPQTDTEMPGDEDLRDGMDDTMETYTWCGEFSGTLFSFREDEDGAFLHISIPGEKPIVIVNAIAQPDMVEETAGKFDFAMKVAHDDGDIDDTMISDHSIALADVMGVLRKSSRIVAANLQANSDPVLDPGSHDTVQKSLRTTDRMRRIAERIEARLTRAGAGQALLWHKQLNDQRRYH